MPVDSTMEELFQILSHQVEGRGAENRRLDCAQKSGFVTMPWSPGETELEGAQTLGVFYQICAVDTSCAVGYCWRQFGDGFFTRPPRGTKVYELVNFIKQEHCGSLGLYVCHESIPFYVFTSEGELVSGDDSMEKHVAMVPVGPEKQLQEEACFHVIVPHVVRQRFLGIDEGLLNYLGRTSTSDSCLNFNIDTTKCKPKWLDAPTDERLADKKAMDVPYSLLEISMHSSPRVAYTSWLQRVPCTLERRIRRAVSPF